MKKKIFTLEEIKRKLERYCVYQDRCHKEIETKLFEYNLIPEAKEHVLLHLLEHNFLNEERFSKSFARGKFRIKKWGKERIIRELTLRDISPYNIKSALKEIDTETYISHLKELIEKKNQALQSKEPVFFKRKKKLFDYAKYKGYETSLILEILSNYE